MSFKPATLFAAAALVLGLANPAAACGDGKACGMCEAKPAAAAPAKAVKGQLVSETFKVSTMKCQKCANGVTKNLGDVAGVSKVDVKLLDGVVTVTYGKGQTDLAKLNAALKGHFKLAPYKAAAVPAAAPAAPAAEAAPVEPAAPAAVN